jgi:UDP-N-acetylglucosamine 1-carboxyvinyltransferase
MSSFKIKGGTKFTGEVKTGFAKNAAMAILSASLMTKEKTILHNVPKIEEVFRFEEIFNSLGVKLQWQNVRDLVIIPPKKINFKKINFKSAIKTKSIIYLIGALANFYNNFKIPRTGGCKLGKRSITSHIYALEKIGLEINTIKNYYQIQKKSKLKGNYIVMYESSDTATNNVIMAAVLAKGKTTIKMASSNYMIQDLCYFLKAMGAKIKGIGTTTLEIQGVKQLTGVHYSIIHDPIESMFWLSLAATTDSELLIKACPRDFIELELEKLKKMNFNFEIMNHYKTANGNFKLLDIQTKKSNLIALKDKIYSRPYPGLNIDNLPFFVPIAGSAKGLSLIHDWCYENRAIYFLEFQKLGCDIMLLDPHRVIIKGPSKWKANELICPPALRPATILVIAMLAAKGTSILRNTYPIDRGYENLRQRLIKLGAKIEKIT